MPKQSAAIDLDRVFSALADPTRRAVVARLGEGPASVSDLAKPLNMSLPSVLQHLQVLEASGLVRSQKIGRVRMCWGEPAPLRAANSWMEEQRCLWEARLDRLESYLETMEDEDGNA